MITVFITPEPLSNKDLQELSQRPRSYHTGCERLKVLGLCLQISEDQLNEIERQQLAMLLHAGLSCILICKLDLHLIHPEKNWLKY